MQDELQQLAAGYAARERLEKPNSQLAQACNKADVWQKRCQRCQNQIAKAQAWLDRQCQRLSEWEAETAMLRERLQRFKAENTVNPNPIRAVLRLDTGFGTDSNLALLIDMGYEIYSKPYGNWLSGLLARMSKSHPNDRQKVGKNAEILAWKAATLPYPLDLGYERFWQSPSDSCQPKQAFSGLLHFGATQVIEDLLTWFGD